MKSLFVAVALLFASTTANADSLVEPRAKAAADLEARREAAAEALMKRRLAAEGKLAAITNPPPSVPARLECFNDDTGAQVCYLYVVSGCGLNDLNGSVRGNLIDQRHKVNNGPDGFLTGVIVCKPGIVPTTAPASIPVK